jgi:hypothetical protein
MNNLSLSLNNSWLWFAIIGLVVYLSLAIYLYRRTNPPISKGLRIFLGIIRYLALGLVVICLLEPVFTSSSQKVEDPVIVFLADNSSSIQTVENYEQKKEFLDKFMGNGYDDLFARNIKVDKYTFSDTLDDAYLSMDGRQTALGKAIQSVYDTYREQNLTAIVIASDGLSNFGSDPVGVAREIEAPVYTIDLGPQKISRDLRIVDINHEPVAYAGRPFEISVEVEGRGFEKLEMPLIISDENNELSRKNIEILGQGERQRYMMEITPQEPGLQNFKIRVPVQPDEELGENNNRNFNLKILKSKKRILLATDKLNWETTFLQRAISSSKDFDLQLSIVSNPGSLEAIRFPSQQDSINAYDLIVLINCANSFISNQSDALYSYVNDFGGSIWYLLSESSLSRVPPSKNNPLLYTPQFDDKYYNDFSFHLSLTQDGKLHPITRIVEDSRENINIWQNLPPFEEHLTIVNPNPGARILAVHPDRVYRGNVLPLIFCDNLGDGKILTFALGPLWKTGFLNMGFGGDDTAYRQLILNSINWLTTREDVERIRLASDQAIYRSGERIGLQATVFDDNYAPLQNSVVNVVVKGAESGDSTVVSLTQVSPGEFEADLGLLPSGDYTYDGMVVWEDNILQKISGKFKVEEFSLEEETLFLPPDIMKKISQAGNGKHYTISDFESIGEDITISPRTSTLTKEMSMTHNMWVLIIILVFFTTEWFIRKRLQLL